MLQNISNILHKCNQSEIATIVEQQNLFRKAHDSSVGLLRSLYVRKEYFKNNFNYIAPIDILLEQKGNKKVSFCYIPIIETIKSLLNNRDIWEQWSKSVSDRNVFENIADGDCIKNNGFFRQHPNALQIISRFV